jgi:hypothetical protein
MAVMKLVLRWLQSTRKGWTMMKRNCNKDQKDTVKRFHLAKREHTSRAHFQRTLP